ncbi:MAG TPA: M81 family metallopeptidase [Burkholderiaceae bacterium]|nr:M81 family metallopeptidase [Burkholderiaceae bacterium]
MPKAVVAMLKHETNTFSPVPTPLSRFGPNGPYYDDAAADAMRGTNTAMGAYLDLCTEAGFEIDTPLAADARPSGPLPVDVYEHFVERICAAVRRGCDALFLDLHGAMVAENTQDAEGTLLERLRAIRPDLPIAVSLDMHANVTEKMVRNCTVIAGYRTYPHVDIRQTGIRAGTLLLRALKGEIRPVMAFGNIPAMMHTLCMDTQAEPFRGFIQKCRDVEGGGVLDASFFGGFSISDIPAPCGSAVCVTDGDTDLARHIVDDVLQLAWERRADCVYKAEPLAQSIARAKAAEAGPVLLIDHADNCASGGTQDTMAVLEEAIRQGLSDIAVFAICDPEAVETLIQAGVGNTVTLPLGGKMDVPAIGMQGRSMVLTGKVKAVTDGTFTARGPMLTGVRASMGRTVVFETNAADIVVCERNHEPWDLGCLRSVGIEPTHKRYILLKSRMHYRAGFLPLAKAIIECQGVGVTASDYGLFNYKRLRRPVYPLDSDARWAPAHALAGNDVGPC